MGLSTLVIAIVIVCFLIIALSWFFYFWKKLAAPEYHPANVIRRFSRSLSRRSSSHQTHLNIENISNENHTQQTNLNIEDMPSESQHFVSPTTISGVSDRPPSYFEVSNQTEAPPPSYDEVATS